MIAELEEQQLDRYIGMIEQGKQMGQELQM